MRDIFLASPAEHIVGKIKNVLFSAGIPVTECCTSASQLLTIANELDSGLVICYRLSDMHPYRLSQLLPAGFDMITFVPSGQRPEIAGSNILVLNLPVDPSDFVESVRMLAGTNTEYYGWAYRKTSNRSQDEDEIIERAKAYLMDAYNISEPSAHRILQKRSMREHLPLAKVAGNILNRDY